MNARSRVRIEARAFTLIELLVVIAIIAILIGIALPAGRIARESARKTATSAMIATLQTGLQTFQADGRIGGGYPPSYSDNDGTVQGPNMPAAGEIRNPFQAAQPPGGVQIPGNSLRIMGAGLLVAALSGFDGLGTAGFKPTRGANRPWAADTDNLPGGGFDPAQSGAYALNGSSPIQPRGSLYVDPSKVQMSQWDSANQCFSIPAEVAARGGIGVVAPFRRYPVYLDPFGFPVLYYRADPGGTLVADNWNTGSQGQRPTGPNVGVYHQPDNGFLTDWASDTNPGNALQLRGDISSSDPAAFNARHKLIWPGSGLPMGNGPFPTTYRACFPAFIYNTANKAVRQAKNPDSFLLISPGPDGRYGTADDICNFKHNGT